MTRYEGYVLSADRTRAELRDTLAAMADTAADTALALFEATQALPFAQEPGDADDQLFKAMDAGKDAIFALSDLLERAARAL